MHTLPDLPAELWEEILEKLSQHDLQCLALASHRLLVLVRPILYRSIRFSNNKHGSFTHDLLIKDKALAERVLKIEIGRHSAFIPTTATHLRNLRTLVIVGDPFSSTFAREEIFKALSRSSPNLKVLKVRRSLGLSEPGYFSTLKGIERFSWEETHGKCVFIP